MHDRSQQLVSQATQQVREFVQIVSDLTPKQLATPCRGEKDGDTVGVLTMRVTAVYDRMTTIVDAVEAAAGEPGRRSARAPKHLRLARPALGRQAAAGTVPPDPKVLAAHLQERGMALVAGLSRLSPAQLSKPLPMTVEGFDHMDKPIGMIVEYLLYCQADRLETMRSAVAPLRVEQLTWVRRESTEDGPERMCRDPADDLPDDPRATPMAARAGEGAAR